MVNDLDAVGEAARAMLQRGVFTQIVVEIDSAPGLAPSSEAKEALRERIESVTRKPVTFRGSSVIRSSATSYNIDALTALSDQRDFRSTEPQVAIWIGYLNGFVEENPYGLGLAMASTAIAIFPKRVNTAAQNSLPPLPPQRLETATLVHELGHLLGLVNLIYESPRERTDQNYPGHSRNPQSVMHKGIEQAFGKAQVRSEPPSIDFDADDLADLRDIAEGRL